MQQHSVRHILQQLDGFYTRTEISVIAGLVLDEICSNKNTYLSGSELRKVEDIVRRLKNGEPIQYVLGKTEFYGMPFEVTPDVLIPRPETEELVEWILSENRQEGCSVLDIGTGSGCIAVTLAKKMTSADLHAWDISEEALRVASGNACLNGVSVRFSLRDILQPVEEYPGFDIIVSNPPYVTESEKKDMEMNVLDFEPHIALFVPDHDALLFYDRIAGAALKMLRCKGKIYFEINRGKGLEVCSMLHDKGFVNIELRKDISGNDRMVRAVK
ncbi:peptide chain release factor N(5)-glutamine methyltransferase [Proteiniphilum sp. UBA5384]|uniref:peptide chain release factor N(5)-glutamine methyltransferase n=1 Tax=Proteiniphilum sp. UBA5384 TaxID=1947279 RepID=UPI0025EEA11F|nr:peptide chain release factor N(5)-glutamine methyltransferase [Proteiniphilum sp. UBA5384]